MATQSLFAYYCNSCCSSMRHEYEYSDCQACFHCTFEIWKAKVYWISPPYESPLNTSLSCLPSAYPLDWPTLCILLGVIEFDFCWEDLPLFAGAVTTRVSTAAPSRSTATRSIPSSTLRGPLPIVTTQGSTVLPFRPSSSLHTFIQWAEIRAHFLGRLNCKVCSEAQQRLFPELVACWFKLLTLYPLAQQKVPLHVSAPCLATLCACSSATMQDS